MAEIDYYGLDMLWKLEKSNVTTKSDLLMLFVHWYLTKHRFRNVGLGDDKTLNDDIERSELLPEGWNVSNGSYALRYAIGKELYILHGTTSSSTFIINLLDVKTLKVSNAVFELESTVRATSGDTVKPLIKDIDKQTLRLRNELELPVVGEASPTIGTQTPARQENDRNPLASDRQGGIRGNFPLHQPPAIPQVGRQDLDPLGRLGGGMLMDPMRPGPIFPRIPGPSIPPPPGARFDPFGPNINRMRSGPDNDHLPPPGYDDMFM